MAVPVMQNSFITGEIAPSILGRQDLARYHTAASTMRNFFPSYRGPAYSRAGTAFVGFSAQTGRAYPPRLIPFQFSVNQGLVLEFGNLYMRVISSGAFVTETPLAITGITEANPGVVTTSTTFASGNWVYITGVEGMTQINGRTVVLSEASPGVFVMTDAHGNGIDTTGFGAYTGGGTAARIYTLQTPYNEADLPYLKYVQSADVMTLCCVNQQTAAEYEALDLTRTSDDDWSFAPIVPEPSIGPPPGEVTGSASASGDAYYEYEVTAVASNGTESVASAIAAIGGAVDITATAGQITLLWNPVAGVQTYNIYKAPVGYGAYPPTGSLFGYAGTVYGNSFIDTNIVADESQVPPTHQNPFARGQVIEVVTTAAGTGYTYAVGQMNTTTGSGANLRGVVQNGSVSGWIIEDAGSLYAQTDTITVVGDGTGATATVTIGAETGTYPSTVGYFQERRVLASSLNNPDTYWMSQPGAFTNFDTRNPTIDSDAITGNPWAVEVNGIQFVIQTSGGLLVMTGLSAWLLAGVGSFATSVQPISPSNQDDVPQAFSGCSPIVPPIKINYDVIYVNSKGSFYYDLPYQLYALSEPIDLTEVSSHLFTGYTIREHAWCEQPYKLLWAVRNDGILLSMTYYKTQQVAGWARHDTLGLFQSVCSVVELPVDALYLAVQRFVGQASSAYMIERMDNRLWGTAEESWCVDCGLSLPLSEPDLELVVSPPLGLGEVTGFTGLAGGYGYSAETAFSVVDQALDASGDPIGSGAVVVGTITNGVVTNLTFTASGADYQQPLITAVDPTNQGVGFAATAARTNTAALATSGAFFGTAAGVGGVVRAGGGIAQIVSIASATEATAEVYVPFPTQPDNQDTTQAVFQASAWTYGTPVSTITGLTHLAGAQVTGLADGNVIPLTTVSAEGTVTITPSASAVVVGLPFQAQMQSVYLDAGQPTVQGQRKKIAAATVRLEASRGVKLGTNQPDGSTLSPSQIAPTWVDLETVPDDGPNFPLRSYNALCAPLRTGDIRVPLTGGTATPGQVCVQQDNPLPANILAFIPEVLTGDTPQTMAQSKQRGRQ